MYRISSSVYLNSLKVAPERTIFAWAHKSENRVHGTISRCLRERIECKFVKFSLTMRIFFFGGGVGERSVHLQFLTVHCAFRPFRKQQKDPNNLIKSNFRRSELRPRIASKRDLILDLRESSPRRVVTHNSPLLLFLKEQTKCA